jgi:hypothetical protein
MKDFERDEEIVLIRTALEKCALALGSIVNLLTATGLVLIVRLLYQHRYFFWQH